MSTPEPMRQAPPPPIASRSSEALRAEEIPDVDADLTLAILTGPPAPAVVTDAAAAKPATVAPVIAPTPKLDLVPDTVPAPHTKLEDILPFFVPPSAPVSRATYEQK